MDMYVQPIERGTIRIVDDDEGFRVGLQRLLNASGLDTVCYGSADECLEADSLDVPGCMLLDIYMPGLNGLDFWETLAHHRLRLPTIFVSACGDVPTSVKTLKEGAIDFLSKPIDMPRLLESVRRALYVDVVQRAEHSKIQAFVARYETLARVERAVFRGIVDGKLNKQLAGELDKCERTIKTYRAQVMSKLNVATLPDLVRVARLLKRSNQSIE